MDGRTSIVEMSLPRRDNAVLKKRKLDKLN